MIKEYVEGILIGFFHKGKFISEPGALILEMRFSQDEHRNRIKWLEERIQLLMAIQTAMNKKGGD